jgi:hypothetical protein
MFVVTFSFGWVDLLMFVVTFSLGWVDLLMFVTTHIKNSWSQGRPSSSPVQSIVTCECHNHVVSV